MRRFLPLSFLILISILSVASPDGRDVRLAIRQLVDRAEAGDARSLYDLAVLHDRGYDSIPVDSARSTALYRLSAEKGYGRAMNYLGFRYFRGEYVRQDVDSALYWITRAAEAGDLSAANNLGYLYLGKDVVTGDYPRALYWLSRAADGGVPTAESQLGDIYRMGLGVTPDTLKAAACYRKAAESGLEDADLKLMAMMGGRWESLSSDSAFSLGRDFYVNGLPVSGVALLRLSARDDNPRALALLGDACSKGKGTAYNHELSIEYFFRAARLGNPSAQFVIAELLDVFPDIFPDSDTPACYWYRKAAEAGIKDAETAGKELFR